MTPRRWVALAVLAALLVVAVAATVVARRGEDDDPAPPDPPAGGQQLTGDFDGDGTDTTATWDGTRLTVQLAASDPGPHVYELGRPGDLLVVGDWDCDRVDTPALYRPSTGEVLYYDTWAERAEARAGGAGPTGGTPEVTQGGDGCDVVEVRPPG
jgi:hypothetical protein